VLAQATQAPKESPAAPKNEAKRDSAAPAAPTASDTGHAPTAGEGKEGTAGTKSEGTPAATAAAESGVPTATAASSASSSQPEAAPADAQVSSGSGLFEQSRASADAPATSTDSETASTPAVDIGGYVRGDVYAGKVPGANNAEMKAGYGELGLQFRVRKSEYGDGFAELRLRDGLQGPTRSTIVDVREAYVNGYFGPLDLRLGKQIIVWGRADVLNPTSNITPNDLRVRSPVEDDRRVGNIGARAFLNFSPFRLEGVWMPLYVATELPVARLPQYIYFGDTRYPPPHLDRGLGAGRLHLELPSVDMSVSFLHGYAPLPGLTLESYTYGISPTVVRISRTAYDHNVVGFDFATVLGDYLGVRGEAAYRRPVDYKNRPYTPRPDLQYVLGVDHTFGPVSIIAQYIGRYVFDWHHETGPGNTDYTPEALASFTQLTPQIEQTVNGVAAAMLAQNNQIIFGQTARVQHLASLRVEWLTLAETLSFSVFGLLNTTTHEWLAYPKIGYKITDRMSTAVGAEIYHGPKNTLFNFANESLSAGYAELRYSF
jgi:hypothetical protein